MTPFILPFLGTLAAIAGITATMPLVRPHPIASLVGIAVLTSVGTLALIQLLKVAGGVA